MAKKIISLGFPQEVYGTSKVKDRQPMPEMTALSFMHVRPPKLKITPVKRRLQVAIPVEEPGQIPQPVKISHAD